MAASRWARRPCRSESASARRLLLEALAERHRAVLAHERQVEACRLAVAAQLDQAEVRVLLIRVEDARTLSRFVRFGRRRDGYVVRRGNAERARPGLEQAGAVVDHRPVRVAGDEERLAADPLLEVVEHER